MPIKSDKFRKATLDDGCNPELILGTVLSGKLEIPLIKRPRHIFIPKSITPFSKLEKADINNDAIGFFEKDDLFSEILISPEKFINIFLSFKAIISPDCSLYWNAPLAVQITNLYRNRAIGSYYQKKGVNVIPLIRWGNELTYTNNYLPEKIAFLGVEKHSIVAIGSYGCIKTIEEKQHFKPGLEAMLKELEPQIVLVYGAMPQDVFEKYRYLTKFIQYPDWITRKHGGY